MENRCINCEEELIRDEDKYQCILAEHEDDYPLCATCYDDRHNNCKEI